MWPGGLRRLEAGWLAAKARLGDPMHFRGLAWGVEGILLYSSWSVDTAWPHLISSNGGRGNEKGAAVQSSPPPPTAWRTCGGAGRHPSGLQALASGLPHPSCVSTICCVQSATLHNKPLSTPWLSVLGGELRILPPRVNPQGA